MESIKTPSDDFNFSDLVLTSPITMNSGTHFIKYKFNDNQFYLQPPKSLLKQNITKGQRRMFCDLLFTNENDEFLRWIENLEEYSKKYIFDNRNNWFESELTEDDIEISFTPILKSYKGGKFYMLRTLIPTYLGTINLKIYDENENNIEIDQIKENDNVMTALEFKGIKCSPRSFQVEIELKQLLLLNKENIFDQCILNKPSLVKKKIDTQEENVENVLEENIKIEVETKDDLEETKEESYPIEQSNLEKEVQEESLSNEQVKEDIVQEAKEEEKLEEEEEDVVDVEEKEEEGEKSKEDLENLNFDEPEEIELPLEEVLEGEVVSIKKPNTIYYEMYKEALKKAKMAKDLALTSYLEAKRIKNQYMLEDLEDSDLEDDTFNSLDD
tara:strand:+ start:21964 stop:23118 length:1155 start_codon:yes stop_codon:yes gene_type:complete